MSTTAAEAGLAAISPGPAAADDRGRARPQPLPTLASSSWGPRGSGPPTRPATPRPLSPAAADRPEMGRLELRVAVRDQRSVAAHQYHQGALRILRPHYLDESGQVCYVLVNP